MNRRAVIKHLEDIVARGADEEHSLYVVVSKELKEILSFDVDGTISEGGETALTLMDNEHSVSRKVMGVLNAFVGEEYRGSFEVLSIKEALEWLKSL